MAKIIVCSRCEEISSDCCGGNTSATKSFRGLRITDGADVVTIRYPFEAVFENDTETINVFNDFGEKIRFPFSEVDLTIHPDYETLKKIITVCSCGAIPGPFRNDAEADAFRVPYFDDGSSTPPPGANASTDPNQCTFYVNKANDWGAKGLHYRYL